MFGSHKQHDLTTKDELQAVNSKLIQHVTSKLNKYAFLDDLRAYPTLEELMADKFQEAVRESKEKLKKLYKQIKMVIRRKIFKAAAEIELEMSDKINLLLKSHNFGFETFRENTLSVMDDLEEVAKRNQNPKGELSSVYANLTDIFDGFDELDRRYNKFKDYLEFVKNFQIDLKYNESELLECFKVSLRDYGSLLKSNLEEHSEIFAETISNLSNRDDALSRFENSLALDEMNVYDFPRDPLISSEITPMHSRSKNKRIEHLQTSQSFFPSPKMTNKNLLRTSTVFYPQQLNNKSMLKLSTIDTSDHNPSPLLMTKKTFGYMNYETCGNEIRDSTEFNEYRTTVGSRKPSSNLALPTGPHQLVSKRSPSMIYDNEQDAPPSHRKRNNPSIQRTSASFQSTQEQIANLSNLTIDNTKFRKVVLTIINCYKSITRINFRSNVFQCEPIELLKEIFARPLPSLFTIDLRKNKLAIQSTQLREELSYLLANNIKVII